MPFCSWGRAGDGTRKSRRYGPIAAIVLPLLALTLIVGIATLQLFHFTHVQASGPKVITGTLTPLLSHSQLQGSADPTQRITLALGLRPTNPSALTSYAQDVVHPGSARYHHFLSAAQFTQLFAPSETDYVALSQYFKATGFSVTHTYNHRLLLTVSGTVAQAEQDFHININTYKAPDGHTYYANMEDPSLPEPFAEQVQSISGLNNATRWQHVSSARRSVDMAALQSTACPTQGADHYTPDQIASAYNLRDFYQAGIQGQGQSVALFELSDFDSADLTAYAACFGHSHTPVQAITVGSTPAIFDSGSLEAELDAELVLSAAPQLSMLKIYKAANNPAGILAEWAQIVQDAVPIVSVSWGQCEQTSDPGMLQQENVLLKEAALQGQTILAASGDSGSAGCYFDNDKNPTALSALDPAAQPFVTSVGGTSLTLAGNAYGHETTWNSPPSALSIGGASGGGISHYWSAPDWQDAPGVRNKYTTGQPCHAPAGAICRETPDVALHTDISRGYIVYCGLIQAGCNKGNPWLVVGGTSAATPLWAAFVALANTFSLRQGGFNLGFINPLLYQIARDGAKYKASFHDVTTGNSDYGSKNHGLYPATEGYDLATGLGSYNAYALASNLVILAQQSTGARVAPTSSIWYFAGGSVGQGFQQYITLQNPDVTRAASVDVTYLFPNKDAVTVRHVVAKSSRTTVDVNQDLHIGAKAALQPVSAIVKVDANGPGIIAERPMYFSYQGVSSGTDIIGATAPATTYYFPVADTRQDEQSYNTYITLLNPGSTQSATAILTYYTGSCGLTGQPECPTQVVVIPPLHRGTGSPLDLHLHQRVAVSMISDQPLVAERTMYLKDSIPTAGGAISGAASTIGTTETARDWLFAEGYTGHNFQEYLVIANFSGNAAAASITLQYANGHTQKIAVTLPALGQYYFDVNQAKAQPNGTCDTTPCQPTDTVSAEVSADASIVAERMMYFRYGKQAYTGFTETIGEPAAAAHSVYAFAEGYTANSFQEYLTMYNPCAYSENVEVTLFANTLLIQRQVLLKAHSRQTVDVNSWLGPIVQAAGSLSSDPYATSMTVQALGNGARVVAERALYFNYLGSQGGTDVIGYGM
ncbi:peptidase S53 [Ktedonosporobacter rubrisoli]|uniref:Peptidase S53 n=1 Tax=Ktedonosporobacter rubrisoli TaxID=2509675 RepID=A0A4P6K024_KTERU|nr:S53 family peptidase [Ktedonosporobacter rubrisoli]QBD81374.1 peptidase S53 [Ktedonosporobacter rubrisoli]